MRLAWLGDRRWSFATSVLTGSGCSTGQLRVADAHRHHDPGDPGRRGRHDAHFRRRRVQREGRRGSRDCFEACTGRCSGALDPAEPRRHRASLRGRDSREVDCAANGPSRNRGPAASAITTNTTIGGGDARGWYCGQRRLSRTRATITSAETTSRCSFCLVRPGGRRKADHAGHPVPDVGPHAVRSPCSAGLATARRPRPRTIAAARVG